MMYKIIKMTDRSRTLHPQTPFDFDPISKTFEDTMIIS